MNLDSLFFQLVTDLLKQQITLSTFILGITVTFWKETYTRIRTGWRWVLPTAWLAFFVAIVTGLIALMGVTGSVVDARRSLPADSAAALALPMNPEVATLAQVMQVSFLIGTLLVLVYGILVFTMKTTPSVAKETPPVT